MKVIVSSTYDDRYMYFIPICAWAWNKLNVDVICFMPEPKSDEEDIKLNLCLSSIGWGNSKNEIEFFSAPEHKEATYGQVSRLYAACLDLPEDEILITSDIDMVVFNESYIKNKISNFDIMGADLVPPNQYPICYISASVKEWRMAFRLGYGTMSGEPNSLASYEIKKYQDCLDEIVGKIECQDFRGNQWSLDQDLAFKNISALPIDSVGLKLRTNGQNQFSTRRYDRDDSFLLQRLNPDTIDFHMPRPGFGDKSFEIILKVLQYHYPNEDFTWLINYNSEYKKLL